MRAVACGGQLARRPGPVAAAAAAWRGSSRSSLVARPPRAAAAQQPAPSQPAQQQEQHQQQRQALPPGIKSVLFSEAQIAAKVKELASAIVSDYRGKQLAIIGVLNGAFIFTSADLGREIARELPDVKVDFMKASSYGTASESSGAVQVGLADLSKWDGHDIILVEDIIDSGHTLARLGGALSAAGAGSVKFVALLDKKGRRRVEAFPDYVGWDCPNKFVVGYGLDYAERYRCLPYVAALEEAVYGGNGGGGH